MERMSYPDNLRNFIEEVVSEIVISLDPEIVILAGSFGKKSWLFSKGDLLSDFEIVFICDNPWPRNKKKQLLKRLNEKFPYEISLKGYIKTKILKKSISNYSNSYPGYLSLDFFDTFSDQSIIYTKKNEIIQVNCSSLEIPAWEAWRLYVNRIGDLLKLEFSGNLTDETSRYFWMKIFESAADAFLIINGKYEKDINIRIENFSLDALKDENSLSATCKDSYMLILKSLEARQKHDLALFDIDIEIKQLKTIVLSWLDYIQLKLNLEEELELVGTNSFYLNYHHCKEINSKYLGFVSNAIIKSNLIRLISNSNLLKEPFKFYNLRYSWRHVILLTISSIFYELGNRKKDLVQSKNIAQCLFRENIDKMENKDFILVILNYWKILR